MTGYEFMHESMNDNANRQVPQAHDWPAPSGRKYISAYFSGRPSGTGHRGLLHRAHFNVQAMPSIIGGQLNSVWFQLV